MKIVRGLLLYCVSAIILSAQSTVSFNEVMFRPVTNGNEFIEIYNYGNEAINLQEFSFIYQNSNSDNFIETGDGFILQPAHYAVIFEGDYDIQSGIYTGIVPETALVLQIDDNSFGSNGMSNGSDRTLYLLDGGGDTVSVYTYSADNEAGISDEKIIPSGENNSENWANSLAENGTPGFKNSVSLFQHDLALDEFYTSEFTVQINSQIILGCKIKNRGSSSASSFIFEINRFGVSDTIFTQPVPVISKQYFNFAAGDSISDNFTTSISDSGRYIFRGVINYAADELTINNEKKFEVLAYEPTGAFGDLVINEIKYAPLNGEPEWVELFNAGNESLNLAGWRIQDKIGYAVIAENELNLEPGEYLILSDNEDIQQFYYYNLGQVVSLNLPSLNNTGDNIKITSPFGEIIDSLEYLPEWGGTNGVSLERINHENAGQDSLNWLSCELSMTASPGIINSVSPKQYDLKFSRFEAVNPFYTPVENISFVVEVVNPGYNAITGADVSLYMDANGNGVAETSEFVTKVTSGTIPSGSLFEREITIPAYEVGEWNFIAEVSSIQDEYPYNDTAFAVVEVVELNINFGDIVINEIMHSPDNQPEWIELFNRTGEEILFRKFYIADSRDTIAVEVEEFGFEAEGYYVFAAEDINSFFKNQIDTKLTSLPTLNNSGDRIYLLDSLYRVIDSLVYTSETGGTHGFSLERINHYSPEYNEDNYGTTISPEGGTPGSINSLSPKKNDLAVLLLVPEKSYYERGEEPRITVNLKNAGENEANSFIINFEQNGVIFSALAGSYFTAGDTLEFKVKYPQLLPGKNNLAVFTSFNYDEYNWNDTLRYIINTVELNEQPYDLVINEIMHSPAGDMPEWIEIYNRSTKSVNLSGYSIADSKDTVNLHIENISLASKQYFILAADSALFEYFPAKSKYKVSTLPTFNNNGDKVILLDSLYRKIDSLDYTGFVKHYGRSIERIDTGAASADSVNWGLSEVVYGGTPGTINSLSAKEYDLAVTEITYSPVYAQLGDDITVTAKVKNYGEKTAFVWAGLYVDSLKITRSPSGDIPAGDSTIITYRDLFKLQNNPTNLRIVLETTNDNYLFNDTLDVVISSAILQREIVINEIFPFRNDSTGEWIELYNNSDRVINIKNLTLYDSTNRGVTLTKDYFLKPDSFVVISNDADLQSSYPGFRFSQYSSSFPSLNNDGDKFYITDSTGNVVDSIEYESPFPGHNPISSLERVSPDLPGTDKENWRNCLYRDHGSPGAKNSVSPRGFDLEAHTYLTYPNNPRINDYFDLALGIVNRGAEIIDTVRGILTINGVSEEVIVAKEIYPQAIENVWVKQQILLSEEITFTFVLSDDEDLRNNYYSATISPGAGAGTILITEIYPNTAEGETEWIELFNPGEEKVNLSGWRIKDSGTDTSYSKIEGDYIISPGEYFVIARDTSLFNSKYETDAIQVPIPSLNNNGDEIRVYDPNMLLVDSVSYDFSVKGYSLERLYFSNNKMILSADNTHSTPGRVNSVNLYRRVEEHQIVFNEIMYEPQADRPEFIELYSDIDQNLNGFDLVINDQTFSFFGGNYKISNDGFFIIADDSSLIFDGIVAPENCLVLPSLTLNNDGGALALRGLFGELIDTVFYSPEWHSEYLSSSRGVSLEKIGYHIPIYEKPWSSCVDISGSTPNRKNSVSNENTLGFLGIKAEPNPFSPDNDGFEDITFIHYSLNIEYPGIKVRIFDDHGRIVRNLVDGLIAAQSGKIPFDGLDDNGNPLRMGIYIILFEAFGNGGSSYEVYKAALVSARKL